MDPTQDDQVVEEIITVLYSRFYGMYLRYEERLHFIQKGKMQLQISMVLVALDVVPMEMRE